MTPENISAILDVLAARFGTTAEHLWGILQRQAYVTAAMSTLALVGMVFLLKWVLRKQQTYVGYDREGWTISCVVIGFLTFATAIFFLVDLGGALNPEYFALKQILDAFGGK